MTVAHACNTSMWNKRITMNLQDSLSYIVKPCAYLPKGEIIGSNLLEELGKNSVLKALIINYNN